MFTTTSNTRKVSHVKFVNEVEVGAGVFKTNQVARLFLSRVVAADGVQ
jgi:hypothetical protein